MARTSVFTFRVDAQERLALASLATLLHRTQSDAVRLLIRVAIRNFRQQDGQAERQVSREGGLRYGTGDEKRN